MRIKQVRITGKVNGYLLLNFSECNRVNGNYYGFNINKSFEHTIFTHNVYNFPLGVYRNRFINKLDRTVIFNTIKYIL